MKILIVLLIVFSALPSLGFGRALELARPQEVPAADGLHSQPCGNRMTCFYTRSGKLVYWAKEYQDGATGRKVIVTGYEDVRRRQLDFLAEISSMGKVKPDFEHFYIKPSGRLNLATLFIPYWRIGFTTLEAIKRFTEDCRKAATPATASACEIEFLNNARRGANSIAAAKFPSEALRRRAEQITDAIDLPPKNCSRLIVSL